MALDIGYAGILFVTSHLTRSPVILTGKNNVQCTCAVRTNDKNMRTIPRSLFMRDSWNDVESRLNPLHDGVAIMQWSRLKSIVIGVVHGKVVWHMALTCMGGDTSGSGGDTSCMLLISLELCGFGGRGGGRGPYSGQLFVKRVYLLLHRLNLLCNHSKNIQS